MSYLAESLDDVVKSMTFSPGEPYGFHRFLDKFVILDKIKWTEELIDDSIRAVCEDLIYSQTDYTWMRFSINKYMTHLNWHRKDAIVFIKKAFDKYAPGRVGLILSLKYESERANQKQVASLIDDSEVSNAIEGIDLVGDEIYFDTSFYSSLFHRWSLAGKRLFAHVGESQSSNNILAAMTDMGVRDICHGIRAVSYADNTPYLNKEIIACALDNDVCFHMALSSNILTGVLERDDIHPISAMLPSKVKITIGTDDPVQCNTDLRREYDLMRAYLLADGVRLSDVESLIKLVKDTAISRVREI